MPDNSPKSAFLCAQTTVEIGTYIARGLKAGLFGGEGLFCSAYQAPELPLSEIDGSLVERTLGPGEAIKVDTGNVAAFEETVQYQAEMVKGFKNILWRKVYSLLH